MMERFRPSPTPYRAGDSGHNTSRLATCHESAMPIYCTNSLFTTGAVDNAVTALLRSERPIPPRATEPRRICLFAAKGTPHIRFLAWPCAACAGDHGCAAGFLGLSACS